MMEFEVGKLYTTRNSRYRVCVLSIDTLPVPMLCVIVSGPKRSRVNRGYLTVGQGYRWRQDGHFLPTGKSHDFDLMEKTGTSAGQA